MQTAPSNSNVVTGFPPAAKGQLSLGQSLVVSIHDVSTITRPVVERMLADLEGEGVPVTSLLVIPDHHHGGRIDQDPDFVSWMASCVKRGHESVLHGFYHLRPSTSGDGMATRLITRSYTAGEGEFYDLSFEEASRLLRLGKDALKACGIYSAGFIAPAWLLGREAARAVKEEGFEYTTLIGSITDCREGRKFPSRSLVYSVRAPWRRSVSLVWNEMLFKRLKESPLMRLGLHPPDWEHPAIRSHILTLIRAATVDRRVTTYRDWLDLWRTSVHEGELPR